MRHKALKLRVLPHVGEEGDDVEPEVLGQWRLAG